MHHPQTAEPPIYVRNCWYVAAWSRDLVGAEMLARAVVDRPILLYRASDGTVVAIEDRCVHRLVPLSHGRREGDTVRCMYHGMVFDRTGTCIEVPGQAHIPARVRVASYPVVERNGWVWIWPGDPALADPALVPVEYGFGDAEWEMAGDSLDYACDYQLINDNLTDFSHLAYVHEKTFQLSKEWGEKHPDVTRLERGIQIHRWMPAGGATLRQLGITDPTDQLSSYRYLVPGVLLLSNRFYPAGTAERSGAGPPPDDIAPLADMFSAQAITPLSARTCRYHFVSGIRAGPGAAAFVEAHFRVLRSVFAEDQAMIEAQQRMMDAHPEARMMPFTRHDRAPVMMRSVISDMAAREASAPDATAALRSAVST